MPDCAAACVPQALFLGVFLDEKLKPEADAEGQCQLTGYSMTEFIQGPDSSCMSLVYLEHQ